MIQFTIEGLSEGLVTESDEILNKNYEETGHIKELPLDIDWDMYLKIGDAFVCFTLRDNGNLVGVLFYCLLMYPHSKEVSFAQQITFYVYPSYRNKSLELMEFCEKNLKKMGIKLMSQSANFDSEFNKVLLKRGYEPHEVTYLKRIN